MITQGCLVDVKMWMSGGSASGSSSVPTRTKRTASPAPGQSLPSGPRPRGPHPTLPPFGLEQRVEGGGRASIELAAAGGAAVEEERRAGEPIAHRAAGAAACHYAVP